GNYLWVRGAAYCAGPVNTVCLHWVRAYFNQARFDHHLLGRLVDLDQHLADVVDVAPSLAEENRVGTFVDLRWIVARQLGSNQRRNFFRARITELIIVRFSWFRGALGGRLDVINVVDPVHEQPLGFYDD